MRSQLAQTPQASGRPSVVMGVRQLAAWASRRASVYLPAPREPLKIMAEGRRPAASVSRRRRTVV